MLHVCAEDHLHSDVVVVRCDAPAVVVRGDAPAVVVRCDADAIKATQIDHTTDN